MNFMLYMYIDRVTSYDRRLISSHPLEVEVYVYIFIHQMLVVKKT